MKSIQELDARYYPGYVDEHARFDRVVRRHLRPMRWCWTRAPVEAGSIPTTTRSSSHASSGWMPERKSMTIRTSTTRSWPTSVNCRSTPRPSIRVLEVRVGASRRSGPRLPGAPPRDQARWPPHRACPESLPLLRARREDHAASVATSGSTTNEGKPRRTRSKRGTGPTTGSLCDGSQQRVDGGSSNSTSSRRNPPTSSSTPSRIRLGSR